MGQSFWWQDQQGALLGGSVGGIVEVRMVMIAFPRGRTLEIPDWGVMSLYV